MTPSTLVHHESVWFWTEKAFYRRTLILHEKETYWQTLHTPPSVLCHTHNFESNNLTNRSPVSPVSLCHPHLSMENSECDQVELVCHFCLCPWPNFKFSRLWYFGCLFFFGLWVFSKYCELSLWSCRESTVCVASTKGLHPLDILDPGKNHPRVHFTNVVAH